MKQILDLQGGRIDAQSANENRGATFRVHLPISVDHRSDREAQAVSAASASATALADLSGLRVLVIDDQSDARSLIARILEDRGANVSTADSGAQAIHELEAQPIDILICDIGMPGWTATSCSDAFEPGASREVDAYPPLDGIRAL